MGAGGKAWVRSELVESQRGVEVRWFRLTVKVAAVLLRRQD